MIMGSDFLFSGKFKVHTPRGTLVSTGKAAIKANFLMKLVNLMSLNLTMSSYIVLHCMC